MLLLGSPHHSLLHLAAAVHIVKFVGSVSVPAFTAKELVVLLPDLNSSDVNCGPVNVIVAIPAIEDILALASRYKPVVAVTPVEHVIAIMVRKAAQEVVCPRPRASVTTAGYRSSS
jgi:hypothetical protein